MVMECVTWSPFDRCGPHSKQGYRNHSVNMVQRFVAIVRNDVALSQKEITLIKQVQSACR